MKRSGISGGLFYDLVCWSMDAWHTSSAPHACSVPGSSHSGLCSTLPSFATSIGVDFVSRESPLNFYSRLTHAFSRVWISTSPSPHLWKQRQQRGGALTSEASTRTQVRTRAPWRKSGDCGSAGPPPGHWLSLEFPTALYPKALLASSSSESAAELASGRLGAR